VELPHWRGRKRAIPAGELRGPGGRRFGDIDLKKQICRSELLTKEDEMTEKLQVYKCEICGNMASVVHAGAGTLVCCGEPMKLMVENQVDASQEKHVPVIEKTADGFLVKVGSVPHPMEAKHFIEWIEIIADGGAYRQFLNPGEAPEAFFAIKAEKVTAREYCNLHGLWKA